MEWVPVLTVDQEVTQPEATNTNNLPQVVVTESLAQYQQTGECRMAHIIDAAQPIHTTP